MTDDTFDRHAGRHASAGSAPPDAAPQAQPAVVARGLVKRYKEVVALDGVDLTVPQGSVLGLLGPNGAGKTTTVRILATLLRPDAGTAQVSGVDVLHDPRAVRRRIGLSGQYAAVDEYLTGYENLEMIGRLYHLGKARSRERARELLAQFRLEDAADRPSRTYSGGMRRRLDLAGALVASPPVIFLDEPTTGLDPRGRADMWEVIQTLVKSGTTLLLTTQYLEEADVLADEIVVIDHGKVIAQGTADQLKLQVGGERLELSVSDASTLARAGELLAPLGVGHATLDEGRRSLVMPVTGGARTLTEALRLLDQAQIALDDVGLRRPTLDDVFLTLTGRPAEDDETTTTKEGA
ncbi:ATP-binding cassette domain-containing protein [Cellulomonas sp. CW35]|uniref:ATP-binding cassette domain-containing protein n=1 Tax=unclassified Cellulomonas TaxID=2620175 RepID=UPI000B8D65A7|nr:ATP-binding cassette domain-containing protein [Cellulomonas sp. PSBB021]ASR54389.1 daunorubicin/doxorubicin resistance ABC transporter ATP-binding protein DrrA [Cellulomonas sp. PSBB021]